MGIAVDLQLDTAGVGVVDHAAELGSGVLPGGIPMVPMALVTGTTNSAGTAGRQGVAHHHAHHGASNKRQSFLTARKNVREALEEILAAPPANEQVALRDALREARKVGLGERDLRQAEERLRELDFASTAQVRDTKNARET